MKIKSYLITLILTGTVIVACSACAIKTAANTTETFADEADITHSTAESEIVTTEKSEDTPPLENAKSLNTYVTNLTTVDSISVPVFTFDYPNNWTVTNESVSSDSEIVELTNGKGAVIRYQYIATSFAYGNSGYMIDVEISKASDSSFVPGYAKTTDYSNLGEFVVAKVIMDSENPYYTVKPKSECGMHSIEGNFVTGFWYDGFLECTAETTETLSPDDEQEVLAILSSFRVSDIKSTAPATDNSTVSSEEVIFSALREGDFSHFAGTYKPCPIYDNMYGGGEPLPNLTLQNNGIITGGQVYSSYPETEPTEVTKNEDGAYRCQVRYNSDSDQDYFLIYPEGTIGENPYSDNDPFLTENVYIQYKSFDGGVMDIIYYKVEE